VSASRQRAESPEQQARLLRELQASVGALPDPEAEAAPRLARAAYLVTIKTLRPITPEEYGARIRAAMVGVDGVQSVTVEVCS
jgi:hypothetical protein